MKEKKLVFANSKNGGGILNRNAFTLIELLAIIVILAIIAVITVPIILNIIENSKKGAAQDSAYGYKDSVNKWYVQELSKPNNENFNLASSYTVTDGKIIDANDSNDQGVLIPVSGEKPSSGELHYSNNVLKGGCLVIGDYQVTFNGNDSSTVKGDCSDYVYVPTMAEMCPGCKFIYTTTTDTSYSIVGSDWDKYYGDYYISDMPQDGFTDNYTTLIDEGGHSHFLGLVENPTTKKIVRAFACGVEKGIPYCLEGYDPSKYNNNIKILNAIFTGCSNPGGYAGVTDCYGSSTYSTVSDDGVVIVYGADNDGRCNVSYDGNYGEVECVQY